MFTQLFRYLKGYLGIRITGYSPERFLNLCKNKGIDVWGLVAVHNAYDMFICVRDFKKLKPILKKTRTKVTIEGRYGLPFFFHKYRKRKLFFAGILLCTILIYSFTFFIWDIDLQGNISITDDVLLEYLETQDVIYGMAKRKVDCEQIAKDIRKQFDDIIWVSASVQGTRLFLHVKENTDTFTKQEEEKEPSDIVADKSGTIKEIVTRNGVPKVVAGDEVESGMILVSGTVEVLNDAKEVTAYRYVTADADILLERNVQYEDFVSQIYEKKKYTGKKRTIFSLRYKKKELLLGRTRHSFNHFERDSVEKTLKLGTHFYLPFVTGRQTLKEYELEKATYSKEEMEQILTKRYQQYCKELKKSGATILDSDFSMITDKDGISAGATITLLEEVGINRKIVDFQIPTVVE